MSIVILLVLVIAVFTGCEKYFFKYEIIEDKAVMTKVAELFPSWEVAQFNKPQISIGIKNLQIKSENKPVIIKKPTGIVFRKKIEGSGLFILEVKGELLSDNPVTMRLRLNGDKPVWMKAPSGTGRIRLSGGKEVEVNFYSEKAFDYALYSITSFPCEECFDNEQLKIFLLREIDGLEETLHESPLKAARLLLQWSSSVSDLGLGYRNNPEAPINRVSDMDAGQIYSDIWVPNAFGSSCGGFAVFYAKVLNVFGIEAFPIDIGVNAEDRLTHVTTVVADKKLDKWKFYIFDPTFNGTYQYAQAGGSVDLDTILTLYDRGKDNEFIFVCKPFMRTALMPIKSLRGFKRLMKASGTEAQCYNDPSSKDSIICDNFNYSYNYLLQGWKSRLEKNGIPLNRDLIVQFLRNRVFSVGRGCSEECRDSFYDMLDKFDIPVGSD